MDADEKLLALKKAYADIILSISKEAAARVMASEKKSVRFQHELKVAKEEGVRMLLRLKQMMDSQISEAEAASLNQQKKIEELEAQLQEAEDIVRDLREELGQVQAELERVKNENLHFATEAGNTCSIEIPAEHKIYSYEPSEYLPPDASPVPSYASVPYTSQRNECNKCYDNIVCTCVAYSGNRDLPSIILRAKEPGLCKNGCTQRIRACERNPLDRDLCLSEETDKVKCQKNDSDEEEGKGTSKSLASGSKTLTELERKLLADIKFGSSQSFLQKRKRAVRRRKHVIPLGGKSVTGVPVSVKDSAYYERNIGSRLSKDKDELHNELGCAKASEKENLLKIRSSKTKHCNARSIIRKRNKALMRRKRVTDSAYYDKNIGSRLSKDKSELQSHLGCAKASEKENLLKVCGTKTMHKDEEVYEKMITLAEVTENSESLRSPDSKMDVEKVDMPSNGLGLSSFNAIEGLSGQLVGERVIKYTFQRKRKKQALGGPESNGSLETEKKTGDCRNGDQKLEQSKSSILMESSRDDRRLVQVAQQLISLSEKKWWR